MTGAIESLGARAVAVVEGLGRVARFAAQIARCLVTPPLRVRRLIREIYDVGVLSLALVCASGVAVGMVLGLQGYNTLVRFGAENSPRCRRGADA